MRLATLSKQAPPIVRTFQFMSRTNRPLVLNVTLEYLPHTIYKGEVEKTKVRVLADQRFINIGDIGQRQEAEEEIHYLILASRVRKIAARDGGPVTVEMLSCIM